MRTTRIGFALLSTVVVAGTLSACSGGGTPEPTRTVTTTATATVPPDAGGASTPAPTSTPSASCGPDDGATAIGRAVGSLPAPAGLSGASWDPSAADASGYDACAPLSWAVVTVTGGTSSSPYAILLFHEGSYLGTATKEQYPFQPTVRRTADDTIAVTYRYATATDANADPSGTAQATYRWDAAAGRVVLRGDVPPAR